MDALRASSLDRVQTRMPAEIFLPYCSTHNNIISTHITNLFRRPPPPQRLCQAHPPPVRASWLCWVMHPRRRQCHALRQREAQTVTPAATSWPCWGKFFLRNPRSNSRTPCSSLRQPHEHTATPAATLWPC